MPLHDDVAPAPAHVDKAVFGEDAQTSRPERVPSLPNLHVERCDVELALEALPDLTVARSLEEEGDSLLDVMASLLDAVALAGNVEFGAQGNVAVPSR